MRIIVVTALLFVLSNSFAEPPRNGTIAVGKNNSPQVWNETQMGWIDVVPFWLDYAKGNDGLTWGRTNTYPKYSDVKEFDTLLIELKQGPCLMEFFHARWRRANDVRRWDDRFNSYGGCPYVFD